MSREIETLPKDQELTSEKRLWQAVILHAIQEWTSGPLSLRRQAQEYLFGDHSDFPVVCQSAGMDVGRLRAGLKKLKAEATHGAYPGRCITAQ
jgi:hypothetical protein